MKSFPFTAQNGDRKVTTADFRELFKKYFTTGVFMNPSTNFQILENSGMTIIAKSGWCNINGTFAYENKDRTLTIQEAEANDRIDRVVLRWNDNVESRKIDIYVVKGVASANPVAPTLTRNESVYELGIATIYVNAFTTNITQSKITDTRLDASVCGVVTGTIKEADTTTLYAQIQDDLKRFKENEQAEFITWFNQIKGQLSTDQAGNLQSQIDKLKPIIDDNSNHLKGLAPMNLLINGDFQINQRGKNEYTTNGYSLDMWKLFSDSGGSYSLTKLENGVRLTSNLSSSNLVQLLQKVSMSGKKEYTLVAKVISVSGDSVKLVTRNNASGNYIKKTLEVGENIIKIPTGFDRDDIYIEVYGTGYVEVEYIYLFEGDIVYPHAKEEHSTAKMRCKRYAYKMIATSIGYVGNNGNIYIPLAFMKDMVSIPTVTYSGNKITLYGNSISDSYSAITSIEVVKNELKIIPKTPNQSFNKQTVGVVFEEPLLFTCEPL